MSKKTANKKKNSSQTVFTRFLFIVAIFVLWIGAIGVRLVHLQVNQHEELREKALDQRRDESKSKMLRGSIFDRSERTLAMSVRTKSLYADPREIQDIEAAAKTIGTALKIKASDIAENLREGKEKNKRFVWIARRVDEEAVRKINDNLKITDLRKFDEPKFTGLHWREEQKRSYPLGTLASHVIGFSNADDVGQSGIEQSQEEVLRGAVVNKWRDRDRLGRVYDEDEIEEREPPKDVYLTISSSVQYKVEEALKKGVETARAKSGTAIALDPRTGEILAMANYPTFDPNRFREFSPELITNRAVQSLYSPGSVFKLVTYASALEEKLITPSGMIDCGNGVIKVANRQFADKHCSKSISYTEALAVSSNIGAIKTAQTVGKENFYTYVRSFGFGDATGIELPAEARGQVRPPEKWFGDSLASMSIGYEISVTALQSAAAYATIANDGVKVSPHIIKEIRAGDGKVFKTTEPESVRIVSPETARSLRLMLREVVLEGTGKMAQLNGYTSAGKTGTAWKYDEKLKRVSGDKYVSSFIGFAPADNPAVIIAVVLDEPQGAGRNGGQVSAPIFREIAEQILPEMNIAPDASINRGFAKEIPEEIEPEIDSITETANESETQTEKKVPVKTTSETIAKVSEAKKTEAKKSEPVKTKSSEKSEEKPKSKVGALNQKESPPKKEKTSTEKERTNKKT